MFTLMPFERKNSELSNYFDDFDKAFFRGFPEMSRLSEFRTDIVDKGDSYALEAELPGFDRQDIKISIEDDMLTISAEHKENKEEKDKNYLRRERRYGSFCRRFDISGIKADAIDASYNNGVLELTLPKQQPVQKASRSVEIK